MPRKSHYDDEDNYNTGYALGISASMNDEELDYKDQDQAARELYEAIEGHSPDCACDYCRLVSDFDSFEEGFSNGYTSDYERKRGW
jgi:hypothetical protein